MDDVTPLERPAQLLQGPHRDFLADRMADFVPLRLVLQPDGPSIELTLPDTVVGRHTDADVRLADAEVSRRHCRFLFDAGHWNVIDLDSLNGVFVNDQRMHEATLYDGDRLRLGNLTFRVRLALTAAPPRPAAAPARPDLPAPARA